MNWYLQVLKEKYATFDGRASRLEYWMFYLVNLLVFAALIILDLLVINLSNDAFYAGYLSMVYAMVLFLPLVSATCRRLQDIGKSGWLILLNLVPVLGGIILLILLIKRGDLSANQYGTEPQNGSITASNIVN